MLQKEKDQIFLRSKSLQTIFLHDKKWIKNSNTNATLIYAVLEKIFLN